MRVGEDQVERSLAFRRSELGRVSPIDFGDAGQREQQQRERQNNPGQSPGAGQKPGQGGQNIDKSANQGNDKR